MVSIQTQAHIRVIAPMAINQHQMARKLLDPKDVSISMNVLYGRVTHFFVGGPIIIMTIIIVSCTVKGFLVTVISFLLLVICLICHP